MAMSIERRIDEITLKLMDGSVNKTLKQKLPQLMLHFKTSDDIRDPILRHIESGNTSLADHIPKILTEWLARAPDSATLTNLMDILKKCDLERLASELCDDFINQKTENVKENVILLMHKQNEINNTLMKFKKNFIRLVVLIIIIIGIIIFLFIWIHINNSRLHVRIDIIENIIKNGSVNTMLSPPNSAEDTLTKSGTTSAMPQGISSTFHFSKWANMVSKNTTLTTSLTTATYNLAISERKTSTPATVVFATLPNTSQRIPLNAETKQMDSISTTIPTKTDDEAQTTGQISSITIPDATTTSSTLLEDLDISNSHPSDLINITVESYEEIQNRFSKLPVTAAVSLRIAVKSLTSWHNVLSLPGSSRVKVLQIDGPLSLTTLIVLLKEMTELTHLYIGNDSNNVLTEHILEFDFGTCQVNLSKLKMLELVVFSTYEEIVDVVARCFRIKELEVLTVIGRINDDTVLALHEVMKQTKNTLEEVRLSGSFETSLAIFYIGPDISLNYVTTINLSGEVPDEYQNSFLPIDKEFCTTFRALANFELNLVTISISQFQILHTCHELQNLSVNVVFEKTDNQLNVVENFARNLPFLYKFHLVLHISNCEQSSIVNTIESVNSTWLNKISDLKICSNCTSLSKKFFTCSPPKRLTEETISN